MNKYFISIFILFTSCQSLCKEEVLMHEIIDQHNKIQKIKYNYDLVGSGGGIPNYITSFILHYFSKDQVDIPTARQIFVNNVDILLDLINSNYEIRPYLSNYPFTTNNLTFRLTFIDASNKMQGPPFVAYVSLINEKIFYSFYDQQKEKFMGNDYNEPYSEARRIVLGE